MRVKVELHRDVRRYLDGCTRAELDDFVTRLEDVRSEPIGKSEIHIEPELSRYMLRRFEFGLGVRKIAVFEYNAALGRMRVLKCRVRRPNEYRPGPSPGSPNADRT